MDARIRPYWPLPLRILLGIAFLFHGLPKLGGGHAGFVSTLQHLGIPAAGFLSWVAALVEVLGGVALLRHRGELGLTLLREPAPAPGPARPVLRAVA